jgi:hypothetical protein
MASSFWTFSRQALVPRLFRDHSPSLDRGQAGAHRTQLPDELLTSKSWFILLICATTAHFDGIDVDFAEAVAILITRILAPPMADRLVPVAPARQAGIDGVLVGVDERARRDGRLDDRLDCCLPDIVEHLQNDVAVALDQAEDRWLLLLQGAPAGGSFEPAAPSEAAFLATAAGLPLCPATT